MFLDHPNLTATNSLTEPDRLERLTRTYGYAMALSDLRGCPDMILKVAQMHDHKGTLIVFWNDPPTELEKELFVQAWSSRAGDGSANVEHEV